VPASRVLAFGDGNNDAPMLAWAGLGVAMPHGRPAAHKAARRIAPGGDPETALARAIAHVLDEMNAA
jgi:hydroxymethylpyrimidine pyrophosphatase-like HAD family hydrolase